MVAMKSRNRVVLSRIFSMKYALCLCIACFHGSLGYAQENNQGVNQAERARANLRTTMMPVTTADCTGVGTPLTRVPLGTVLPFAGSINRIPQGWLPCDGRSLEIAHHPELFCAIGTSWGADPAGNSFNIPDLRGLFVRGVDAPESQNPAGRDLGVKQRGALKPGANVGAKVGSYQLEATKAPLNRFAAQSNGAHSHHFSKVSDDGGDNDDWITAGDEKSYRGEHYTTTDGGHGHSILGGDNETRPKNVYVNWIIFAPEPQPTVRRSEPSLTESSIK